MPSIRRIFGTIVMVACLAGSQWSETVLANTESSDTGSVVTLTTSREPETLPLLFHNEDGTAAGVVETMPHRPI